MSTFMLRDIDPALWQRVKNRLQTDGLRIREVALRLFELYAEHGLAALEKASAERS